VTLTIGSLFSGVGGLELGLERAGLGRVVWQVEKDPYCLAVLARHWPNVERHADVKEFCPRRSVDVVCGGFPCQPWSYAGKRRGAADERHLWPEFARIIEAAQPAIVVGENVPGLRASGLRGVLADLARLGFDAEWTMLGAADVGAPHLRKRLFIVATHPDRTAVLDEPGWLARTCERHVANADGEARRVPRDAIGGVGGEAIRGGPDQPRRRGSDVADADGAGLAQRSEQLAWSERAPLERSGVRRDAWPPEPNVGRVAHGVPARVDRLRCLGNAVVPQVAEVIGRAIAAAIVPRGRQR
jgi:DNA (cytosine-5)-methyltransferase 1